MAEAPDSLPAYLVNPLERQDVETLRDAREFVDKLIEEREREIEREIEESDLPDDAEIVEEQTEGGRGTLAQEFVTCGDDSCHCSTGDRHGPYLYRYYRDESGKLISEYVGKA